MKLFMVIYIAGKVAGSVGPLPYDMQQCLERRLEPLTGDATLWTFVHHGITRTKGDITVLMRCEEREQRPTEGETQR